MVGKVTPNDKASASLLPAIMGLSTYASPNDALMGCIHAINGHPPDDISNEAMGWGDKFEPEILKEAALRLGLDNLDISHSKPYFHQFMPLACSLDGTAYGRGLRIENDPDRGIFVIGQDAITLDGVGVLEAKLTAYDVEDVPPLWRGPVQLQAQMACVGATWGAVCTLFRGTALRVYLFAPHEPTLKAIAAAVADFEKRLETYRQTGVVDYYPPASSADANRAWPVGRDDVEPLGLGAAEEKLCDEVLFHKAEIKRHEKEIDKIEKKIKAAMRKHTRARAGKYQITWPMRAYEAKPAYVVPASEARVVRQSTLTIKEKKWEI